MKCIYYKKTIRKTNELVYINFEWVNNIEKFLKEQSNAIIKTEEITEKEFYNLKSSYNK